MPPLTESLALSVWLLTSAELLQELFARKNLFNLVGAGVCV